MHEVVLDILKSSESTLWQRTWLKLPFFLKSLVCFAFALYFLQLPTLAYSLPTTYLLLTYCFPTTCLRPTCYLQGPRDSFGFVWVHKVG